MNKQLNIIAVIALIVLALFGGCQFQKWITPECPKYETVVIRDTVKAPVPDGKTVRQVGSVKVKPVAKITAKPATGLSQGGAIEDTPEDILTPPEVIIDENGEVEIPITEKEYITDKYKAVVRGYQPELKSIDLYTTEVRTVQDKPRRWALTVGPGCSYTPEGFQPGVNVTLGFVIWSK